MSAGEPPAPTPHERHYATFFGLAERPEGFGLVIGNCQAESLRIVLDAPDRPTLRVPPVHELTAAETVVLHELLAEASFLVAQPVRDDYHGLPLGTAQLRRALRPGARVAIITPLRSSGLYPAQASLHVPGVEDVPPLVAYHDVRVLAEAAGVPVSARVSPERVRAIADDSLAELRRREERTDVVVSDLLAARMTHFRTINHPGEAIWMPVAERVLDALRLPGAPTEPGRPLLNAVRAPREEWVLDVWGLQEEAREHWIVGDDRVDPAAVADAHRVWYARHPQFVAGALPRLAGLLAHWAA